MSMKINIPQFLRHLTNDMEVVEVNASTVGECLEQLVKRFPSLEKELFDRNGKLHSYLDIYINEESAYPEELKKPVKDGDELSMLVIFGGG